MVSKLTRVKNWYQILTYVKNWYQSITEVKIWYLIVTDASDKTVKNWNQMQNAADWGVVFYHCEEYACMLYGIRHRTYFSQSARYWFEMYSNKKETSDFHGTVSFDPIKMLQQK